MLKKKSIKSLAEPNVEPLKKVIKEVVFLVAAPAADPVA
jgi:hypothetical protein